MDLIAFLNARLDEDEAEAKATADADAEFWADVQGDGTFFAMHDPARVLREVEAKRAIVAACAETLQGEDSHDYLTEGGTGEEYELARFVLRQLAAAWSNHPDCRPEWKP